MVASRKIKTGDRFGSLTIINLFKRRTKKNVSRRWAVVRCDCETEFEVRLQALTTRHTKSCGCLRLDILKDKRKTYIGQKFHHITVVASAPDRKTPSNQTRRYVLGRCDCGNTKEINLYHLYRGKIQACGHVQCAFSSGHEHGYTDTPLYAAYYNMLARCYSKTLPCYPNYGGRGIKVCDSWRSGFLYFLQDMGPSYKEHLTLERVDVNKGYCKDNCIWATWEEQAQNTRRNVTSAEQVHQMRALFKSGASREELTQQFKITRQTLNKILARSTWKNVK